MKKITMIFAIFFFFNLVSAYNFYPFSIDAGNKIIQANNYTYKLLPSGLISISHENTHITNLGIAIYGETPSPNYLKSWDVSWTWQIIENTDLNITVLGTATQGGFTYQQEWFFQRYGKPKLTHIFTNQIGTAATNMELYYIFDVNENNITEITYYDAENSPHQFQFDITPDFEITQSINTTNGKITFSKNGNPYFDFTDLFNEFNVNYVFAGNLNNATAQLPNTNGFIIGFTKGNGTLQNGQTIIADPLFDDFQDDSYSGTWTYSETETTLLLSYGTEESGFLQVRHNGSVGATNRNATGYFQQLDANNLTLNDFPLIIDFNSGGTLSSSGNGGMATYDRIYLSDGSTDINIFDEYWYKDSINNVQPDGIDKNITLTYTATNTITVNYCKTGVGCWQYTKNIAALDTTNLKTKFYKYTNLVAAGGGDTAGCTECTFRISDMNYDPDNLDINFTAPIEEQTIVSNRDYNISWNIINKDANATGHLFDLNYGTTSDANIVIINDGNVASTPGLWCDSNNFINQTTCYYTWTAPDVNGDFYLKIRATSDDTLVPQDINKTVQFSMQTTFFLKVQYYDEISGDGVIPDAWIISGTEYTSYCDTNGLCEIPDLNGWTTQQRTIIATKSYTDSNTLQATFGETQAYEGKGTLTLRRLTLNLINEETGGLFDLNLIDGARVYTLGTADLNINLKDSNQTTITFTSDANDNTLRFEFDYNTGIQVSREFTVSTLLDFNAIIDLNSIPVCVAETQTFYEVFLTSYRERPVLLKNEKVGCISLATYTKYAYQDALFVSAFTIPLPYNLYVINGTTTNVLALLDGSQALTINLEVLDFAQNEYDYTIEDDSIGIYKNETAQTLQIKYFNDTNSNTDTVLNVYLDSNLLYTYTESTNPNDFTVNVPYNLWSFDANLLTITITKVLSSGGTETITYYYYFDSDSGGVLSPTIALVISVLLTIFGITLVSYRIALAWFGFVILLISLFLSSLAPSVWYLTFIQAMLLIITVYIALTYKNENMAVT